MNFDQLVQEVYNITKRPDLVAETESAVRSATLKAHGTDFYSKDIWEDGIEFPGESYRQSWDYMSTFSNFRALKYVKRVEDQFDDEGKFFDIVTPEETLDSYGVTRNDIAYIAGRVLELRSSVPFSKMLVGCYVFPLVTQTDFRSWIADIHPWAIINEAVRIIYSIIGFDEQATRYDRLVAEQYAILKMTGISDVGY